MPETIHFNNAPVPLVLTINGQLHQLAIEPRTTLLDLLREHLGLMGTKKGCDHGQCGACTVLLDGERRVSCLTLAVSHDEATVTTVEGLAHFLAAPLAIRGPDRVRNHSPAHSRAPRNAA